MTATPMGDGSCRPVRVVVIDDYDIVVAGTSALLARHGDLVQIVDRTPQGTPVERTDIALLECFAMTDGAERIRDVLQHPLVEHVAVYTWGNDLRLVEASFAFGADGFLSKGLPGDALARALADVHAGERVVATPDTGRGATQADGRAEEARRWPGREHGLTERESEVLALITQGRSNADIAAALYLSPNSVKTHTRKLFRKLDVATRTQAALWGIDQGFRPDREAGADWG